MSNCHYWTGPQHTLLENNNFLKCRGRRLRDPQHKPHRPFIYAEALPSLQYSSITGMPPDFFSRL